MSAHNRSQQNQPSFTQFPRSRIISLHSYFYCFPLVFTAPSLTLIPTRTFKNKRNFCSSTYREKIKYNPIVVIITKFKTEKKEAIHFKCTTTTYKCVCLSVCVILFVLFLSSCVLIFLEAETILAVRLFLFWVVV